MSFSSLLYTQTNPEQTYFSFGNLLTIFDCAKNDDNDEFEPATMKT